MINTILEQLLSNNDNNWKVRKELSCLLQSFMNDTKCNEDDVASIVGNVTGDEIKAFFADLKDDIFFTTFSRLCSLCGAKIKLEWPKSEELNPSTDKITQCSCPKTETHEKITVTYSEKAPNNEKVSYAVKFDSDEGLKVEKNNDCKCKDKKERCCEKSSCAQDEKDAKVKKIDDKGDGGLFSGKATLGDSILGILCNKKLAKTFMDLLDLDDDEEFDIFRKEFDDLGL